LRNQLSPEVLKLLKQCMRIKGTNVPVYRILDVLASEDGDISKVANFFREVQERPLREVFHSCAQLLRALEPYVRAQPPKDAASLPGEERSPKQLATAEKVKLFVDGCSKGNPGPAGIGLVFTDLEGRIIQEEKKFIGRQTNNYAEYAGLVEGLKKALDSGVKQVFVFTDSELLAKQMLGEYKIRNKALFGLQREARRLISQLEKFTISCIARNQNKRADKLASAAAIQESPTDVQN
jgi:ribonuclease HI